MSNPDRTLLDQINTAWDERSDGNRAGEPNANSYADVINALHQADRDARPRAVFREQLREQLLATAQAGHVDNNKTDEEAELHPYPPVHQVARRFTRCDGVDHERRRWFSHVGELAAIIAILVVATAGVALWQSGDDGMLPGAGGDDGSDDESEAVATPEPTSPGVWTDLTLEEAALLTPFEIKLPDNVLNEYEIDEIRVVDDGVRESGLGHEVPPWDDDAPWMSASIEIVTSKDGSTLPSIWIEQRNSVPQVRPVDFDGELSFDGIDVPYMFRTTSEGVEHAVYTWHQDGLNMMASSGSAPGDQESSPEHDLPDTDAMQAIIEALIAERDNEDAPPEWPLSETPQDDAPPGEGAQPITPPERHQALTVEEAQEIVPYDIIDPRDAHEEYEVAEVDVMESPGGGLFTVTFWLNHREVEDREFVINQRNSRITTPNISEAAPASGDNGQEEIEIDGLSVTHTIQSNLDGDQLTFYNWHQNATGITIDALSEVFDETESSNDPEHAVPADDLREFVTHIVESRTSDDAPPEPETQEPSDDYQAPADGGRTEVTLEEARELAPFELLDTSLLPGELRFATAEVARHENGRPVTEDHPEINTPNWTHLHFASPPDADVPYIVEIIQTTDLIPNPEGEMIEVAGHPVEYVEGTMGTSFQTGWVWEVGKIEYGLLVTVIDQDDVDSPEELEAAIPLAEEDIAPIIESALQ